MSIADLFIKRPVMTTLVMLAILFFGLVAYTKLPVSDLPTIDFPTISVNASLPGANPETMASSVATPLEKQFSTIAGLDVMTSSSGQGSTNITLQFTLDRDIDDAAADVNASIAQTLRQLPQGMVPPSYQKVDPSAQPIIYFAMTSSTLPLSTLNEYGETSISQKLSTIEGVANVNIFGTQKYAVRIQLDPQALAARGIGIDEVVSAVQSSNSNLPTGILWGTDKAYAVEASGQLTGAAEFAPLVVAWRNGTRGIVLAVQRQPGTNTVQVAARVRAAMDRIRAQLPASVQVEVLYDRSISINESVNDVKFTLMLTVALVVMVIFLFLRSLSATIIPSLALPMSVVGTFAVMYKLGYSLDNLSLMALTLSVGFVVDDAIVMLENIVRHLEMGKKPFQAALDGAREIGFTILSMTVSLVAVFIPLLLLGGLIGRLFHEFAVTIGVAILVSGFVSLTLTPMLCARFLKSGHTDVRHNRVLDTFERWYQATHDAYVRSLEWVMQRRRAALAFTFAILVGTLILGKVVKTGFIPNDDIGQLFATTETAEGTSFPAMMEHQAAAAAIVAEDPNVEGFMSAVGGRGSTNTGRIFMRLKPRHDRSMNSDEIAASL
ncbi:MAG TPA: efflux RND transporter permease subunit, partial [Gemmatimonadales bacterium]|nr:efflux RND transporter permease subunit [Gemmatimonadales bacterium]